MSVPCSSSSNLFPRELTATLDAGLGTNGHGDGKSDVSGDLHFDGWRLEVVRVCIYKKCVVFEVVGCCWKKQVELTGYRHLFITQTPPYRRILDLLSLLHVAAEFELIHCPV